MSLTAVYRVVVKSKYSADNHATPRSYSFKHYRPNLNKQEKVCLKFNTSSKSNQKANVARHFRRVSRQIKVGHIEARCGRAIYCY